MKTIKEKKGVRGNYYEVYIDDIKIKEVKIIRVKREKNNFIYLFLLDSNGKVIDEVYKFINIYCKNESINSREQMINGLKVLYSYKEMESKELEQFEENDFKRLSNLILGIGIEKECNESCGRNNNTHNIYFDVIRKFYRYLHINNNFLFEQRVVHKIKGSYGLLGHIKEVEVKKYITNKKSVKLSEQYIPKYISLDDYINIVKYIENGDSGFKLRNRIIIDLMYTTGMRLGEVLGLTFEDIKENGEDKRYGTVYIRNRVSDKSYENAKTCLKVHSAYDYNTAAYKTKNIGYQTVYISPYLFELIKKYMDESRSIFNVTDTVMDNIINFAKADTVEGNDNNQYIFLNKNGNPLSSSGWNKQLKEIFIANNLAVDKDVKKNNLSHRFRHGYAMYLIDKEGRSIEYVKDKMRHSSINSTLVYYNPTEEEKLKNTSIIEKVLRQKLEGNKYDG